MKYIVCFFLLSFVCIEASETSRQKYLELIQQFPALVQNPGDCAKGEIQIITNPEEMAAIEQANARDVGVVWRDKYWLWINDACLFPSGFKGIYARIVWVRSLESCHGIVVMPFTQDGKIVVNCNFRHATRSWEIELIRGLVKPEEDIYAAAKRKVAEETGMIVDELTLLGQIPPDTGVIDGVVPVFTTRVIDKQSTEHELTEAIEEILVLSIEEIKQAFVLGYLECNIRGKLQKVPFRDPFLAYAILMYEIKK